MSETERARPPDWHSLPDLLTVSEAARLLRIGRNTAYEGIHTKEIPHVKLGRRILIPKHGLMMKLGVPTDPNPAATKPSPVAEAPAPTPRPATLGLRQLALPTLKPIPMERFEPAFAASLVCGGEMPDGSLWLMDQDGTQITVSPHGAEISRSLIHLTVSRSPRPRSPR